MVKNILLIDDDEDDREIFLEALQSLKLAIRPITASNGLEALRELMSSEILPSLIFLDLNMPVMDGKEFLGRIKSDFSLRTIPVVVLSTSSDSNTITEIRRLGARDFVTKPDDFELWGKVIWKFLTDLR